MGKYLYNQGLLLLHNTRMKEGCIRLVSTVRFPYWLLLRGVWDCVFSSSVVGQSRPQLGIVVSELLPRTY